MARSLCAANHTQDPVRGRVLPWCWLAVERDEVQSGGALNSKKLTHRLGTERYQSDRGCWLVRLPRRRLITAGGFMVLRFLMRRDEERMLASGQESGSFQYGRCFTNFY